MYIKRSDAIKGKRAETLEANADFMMGRSKDEYRILSIGFAEGWNAHIEYCEDIPSAEKQGEWIKHDEERDYCSVCKHIFKTRTLTKQDKWTTYVDDLGYNYCPNCGARMTDKDIDVPYKIASYQRDYDSTYEPTYNEQDGSM